MSCALLCRRAGLATRPTDNKQQVSVGGGGQGLRAEEKFSRHTIPKLHVFDHIFKKNLEISKQKGIFDVNLVFTATLACTKQGTFHHKKGHF
jgi:hypothetical protein